MVGQAPSQAASCGPAGRGQRSLPAPAPTVIACEVHSLVAEVLLQLGLVPVSLQAEVPNCWELLVDAHETCAVRPPQPTTCASTSADHKMALHARAQPKAYPHDGILIVGKNEQQIWPPRVFLLVVARPWRALVAEQDQVVQNASTAGSKAQDEQS
jgi:hypothetical protein